MPVRLSEGKGILRLDVEELERQLASLCDSNGITVATYPSRVNNLTAAEQTAFVKAILRSFRFTAG